MLKAGLLVVMAFPGSWTCVAKQLYDYVRSKTIAVEKKHSRRNVDSQIMRQQIGTRLSAALVPSDRPVEEPRVAVLCNSASSPSLAPHRACPVPPVRVPLPRRRQIFVPPPLGVRRWFGPWTVRASRTSVTHVAGRPAIWGILPPSPARNSEVIPAVLLIQ